MFWIKQTLPNIVRGTIKVFCASTLFACRRHLRFCEQVQATSGTYGSKFQRNPSSGSEITVFWMKIGRFLIKNQTVPDCSKRQIWTNRMHRRSSEVEAFMYSNLDSSSRIGGWFFGKIWFIRFDHFSLNLRLQNDRRKRNGQLSTSFRSRMADVDAHKNVSSKLFSLLS